MLDANLKSLVGILPILGAFIEFRDFRMVLVSLGITLEPQLEKGIEMEPDCKFLFLWISSILGWFLYRSKHSHKKRKDSLETRAEPVFYALMLKTKVYKNPFFPTMGEHSPYGA